MIDIPHLDDAPYLPAVGEVYWVDSAIIHPKVRAPEVFVHPFRSNPYTDSGVFVHPAGRVA